MNETTKPAARTARFRWRALTSVLITAAFLVLTASGIVLFISPPGRVANWTNWGIFGLRKSEWAGLHIVFSTLFLMSAVVHIFFNWRPVLGYFRSRWNEASGMRWEWLAALVIGCGIYWGTRAGAPPFSTLIAWGDAIRESWESPRERAPIPHAELLTMKELADKAALDFATVVSRLEAKSIKDFTTNTLMRDLANNSRMSAQQLYDIMTASKSGMSGGAAKPEGEPSHGGGPGGAGGGPGRKTLAEFCAGEGIDLPSAVKRLEAKGIKSETTLTLREIAVNNGYSKPYDLLEIIRAVNK
jgi:hypothetical protein